MWLFTKHGFFSIVQKQKDEFHVRSRSVEDLHNLTQQLPNGECFEILDSYPGSDYPYRAIVNARAVALIMFALADTLDYSNFKGEVSRTKDQAYKLGAYHDIWQRMRDLGTGGRKSLPTLKRSRKTPT